MEVKNSVSRKKLERAPLPKEISKLTLDIYDDVELYDYFEFQEIMKMYEEKGELDKSYEFKKELIEFNVSIKDVYSKVIPFGKLQARLPVAVIFSFYAYRNKVCRLMQILSHSTRAYFTKANRLRGFLIDPSIDRILRDAQTEGKLEEVTKN